MDPIIMYLILVNAVTLLLMLIDKQKSIRRHWRIPEGVLFLFCLLGGSFGGNLGMYLFRHKTKHLRFTIGFPIILILHILVGLILFV